MRGPLLAPVLPPSQVPFLARFLTAGLVALLTVGCSTGVGAPELEPAAPSTSLTASPGPTPTTRPSPSDTPSATPEPGPSYSSWVLGARVLPRRADGYGEVRPTPPSLRNRRYPTLDVLAPPADDRFHASVSPVDDAVRKRMGSTYQTGCPVALEDLSYVTVAFRGYDGAAHTGELVVADAEARDVVGVFRALFAADFPIEEMRLPTAVDLAAPPTGDGNNTAAFVCRPTTGQTSGFSAHAYGLALDLNPFVNPYLKGDLVLPELASAYLDRSWVRPGMVLPSSLAVREFARIGWSWGGDFSTLKDYQHFTATGR